MIGRKLCGYDLNGWRDRAARNWDVRPGGEEEVGVFNLGGCILRSSVVRVGEGRGQRWIGGAQAAMAPHGLGGGWGEVGAPDRRTLVRSMLEDDATSTEKLAAAISGLARSAKFSAVAIDDHPATTERLQERLIEALTRGRAGRGLLVWRPVLAVLGAITEPMNVLGPADGLFVGVVNHTTDGFTLQRLRLRKETGRTSDIFAPERRQTATVVPSPLGYKGLFESAKSWIRASAGDEWSQLLDLAQSTVRIALEGEAPDELLRNARGDFVMLETPPQTKLTNASIASDSVDTLDKCDVVLFETLSSGTRSAEVVNFVQEWLGRSITVLNDTVVAAGALEAARRLAEGDPIYFDFLPQISTIVLGPEGATSYDLIGADETLPAGRVYRSRYPAKFAIQSGQSEFSVHLKKELVPWPRKATVDIGVATTNIIPVELSVEQVPAAGRAKLIVNAPMIARQFMVDWDAASEIRQPWDELIAELGQHRATIPRRLVLESGTEPWEDSPRGPGLFTLLEKYGRAPSVNWEELAGKLSARPNKRYCISSDGELPASVPQDMRDRLDVLTARALEHVRARAAGRVIADNGSLKFLTWQFRRAPREVPDLLLEAWDARSPNIRHPFISHPMNWVLVYQGLGRTSQSEEQERLALAKLFRRSVQEWSYREETAAVAFLLSRSDTAPLLLERTDVEKLVRRVLIEFEDELGSDYTRFNYAPFLLGGLLRWRLRAPTALVAGQDSLADAMREAILKTLDDFKRRRKRSERFERAVMRYRPLLEQLLEELDGRGGNPDLLLDLYDNS